MRLRFYLQRFLLLPLIGISSACSPAARSNIGAALNSRVAGAAPEMKIMIFGGEGHQTYLGCLSCGEYATDSVLATYNEHGNPYSNASIWNHYSDFGSRYSDYGACNPYANDPPVIVDSDGKFYGRLTLNSYHPQIGVGVRYHDWLMGTVCGP